MVGRGMQLAFELEGGAPLLRFRFAFRRELLFRRAGVGGRRRDRRWGLRRGRGWGGGGDADDDIAVISGLAAQSRHVAVEQIDRLALGIA